MRPVFHKFLKFRKFRKNFKDIEVYGWSRQILKKSKKNKRHRFRSCQHQIWLQLNYSIGGNFNIHPPTFSMDGRFPFCYAPGSFPMQIFPHFHPTLAGPISVQAGPSATRTLRKCRRLLRKATFRICMCSFTHLWYRTKKATICCCCMSIICRSRMAIAKQKAWFGLMFITVQYTPKMTFDQLCLF